MRVALGLVLLAVVSVQSQDCTDGCMDTLWNCRTVGETWKSNYLNKLCRQNECTASGQIDRTFECYVAGMGVCISVGDDARLEPWCVDAYCTMQDGKYHTAYKNYACVDKDGTCQAAGATGFSYERSDGSIGTNCECLQRPDADGNPMYIPWCYYN